MNITLRAFTLVEVLVVVTVLAILATLTTIGVDQYLESGRDSERESKAAIITEALEAYYDENGEYPTCSTLANAPTDVLADISSEDVQTPTGIEEVDIYCGQAVAATDGDYFYYSGVEDNGAYISYELQYIQETEEEVETIDSRRETAVVSGGGGIYVAATINGTDAQGEVLGSVACDVDETSEIQIRTRINDGTWSEWVTSSLETIAATEGYSYGFQARSNCSDAFLTSPWIETAISSVTQDVTAPNAGDLAIAAAISSSTATGTASGGTCASGTSLVRQIRHHSTNVAADGSWSGWTTGSTRNQSASQGYKYTFQQQARCEGVNANSSWVASGTDDAVRGISTPSALTMSDSTSGNTTTFTRTSYSCPSGTTAYYQKRLVREGYDSGWYGAGSSSSWTWTTTAQGYDYRSQSRVNCSTYYDTSSYSSVNSTASYIRPVSAPGAPYNWSGTWESSTTIRFAWTLPSCGSGTSISYTKSNLWMDSTSGWYWTNTGTDGWKYSPDQENSGAYGSSTLTLNRSRTSDLDLRFRAAFKCKNFTSGRESGWGTTGTSPTYSG